MIGRDELLPWDELNVGLGELPLLRDEMMSLEEAGLLEDTRHQPSHGFQSVPHYIEWWSDGEDSRYEAN